MCSSHDAEHSNVALPGRDGSFLVSWLQCRVKGDPKVTRVTIHETRAFTTSDGVLWNCVVIELSVAKGRVQRNAVGARQRAAKPANTRSADSPLMVGIGDNH
jgi:hypothetical protein